MHFTTATVGLCDSVSREISARWDVLGTAGCSSAAWVGVSSISLGLTAGVNCGRHGDLLVSHAQGVSMCCVLFAYGVRMHYNGVLSVASIYGE